MCIFADFQSKISVGFGDFQVNFDDFQWFWFWANLCQIQQILASFLGNLQLGISLPKA